MVIGTKTRGKAGGWSKKEKDQKQKGGELAVVEMGTMLTSLVE